MFETELKILKKETMVFPFGASTKGGQRANRKKIGIRLHHIPSGIKIKVIKERDQARNRKIAFEKLQRQLRELNRPKKIRIPTKAPKYAKLKRLKEKQQHSQKKYLRRKFNEMLTSDVNR